MPTSRTPRQRMPRPSSPRTRRQRTPRMQSPRPLPLPRPRPTSGSRRRSPPPRRAARSFSRRSTPSPSRSPSAKGECGTPAPVRLISIGKNPRGRLLAAGARHLRHGRRAAQVGEQGRAAAGARSTSTSKVVKIETMSDYSCRNAYGRVANKLSEHGKANALDIRGFVTRQGQEGHVLEDWGETQARHGGAIAAAKEAAEQAEAPRPLPKPSKAKLKPRRAEGRHQGGHRADDVAETASFGAPGQGPRHRAAHARQVDGPTACPTAAADGRATSLRLAAAKLGGPKPPRGR